MICPKCKIDIERPLVLFKGMLACPGCGEKFVAGGAMSFTKENDEIFHLSENAFFRGIKKRDPGYVDLAIELCKRACNMGNPEANFRMGYYYDRNLIGEPMTKNYRIMIAYEYYDLVCKEDILPGDLSDHVDISELKHRAADRLLRMLSDFPEGVRINPRYSVKRNQEELVRCGLIGKDDSFSEAKRQNIAAALSEGLSDLLGGKTNALISVYRLNGEQLASFLPNEGEESPLVSVVRNSRILFRYYLKASGEEYRSKSVSTASQMETFEQAVRDHPESEFILLFFNGSLKPHFLKIKDIQRIQKALFDDVKHVDTIIKDNEGELQFSFCEDDFYYCLKQGNYSDLGVNFRDYINQSRQ